LSTSIWSKGAVANRQEDLQIRDRSPQLILEIKGLAGKPTEADTGQVTKYVVRRMREGVTDVQGLVIINHERNIPAAERDHKNVFTEAQISDARGSRYGLLTTWDLFRLLRGLQAWRWKPEVVQDIFYGIGRLIPVPSHYEPVGVVAHFWTKHNAFSIDCNGKTLGVGSTLGFVLPDRFEEELVSEMHLNGKTIQAVSETIRVSIPTKLKRSELPDGTIVYRVEPSAGSAPGGGTSALANPEGQQMGV
jgi:hypothetical protein